jgi:hypothetical protein
MTKTAEEIYDEALAEAVRIVVLDFFSEGISHSEVSAEIEGNADFLDDVYKLANEELDTLLQRWIDSQGEK